MNLSKHNINFFLQHIVERKYPVNLGFKFLLQLHYITLLLPKPDQDHQE